MKAEHIQCNGRGSNNDMQDLVKFSNIRGVFRQQYSQRLKERADSEKGT